MKQKAFALSFTIWIVAILSLLAALYLNYGKSTVYKSGKLHDKLAITIQSESIVELLKFYFATGKFVEGRVENKLLTDIVPSFPQQVPIDSSKIVWGNNTIILQDSAGLISLYDVNTIAKYLGYGTYHKYGIIKDSLEDWLDIDDFSNLNGAEQSFYRQEGKQYIVRNGKYFTSFEELMLVKGIYDINLTKLKELQRHLTISDKIQYNLFTLQKSVLQRRYNLSESNMEQLTEAKQKDVEQFRLLFNSLNSTPLDFEVDSFFPSGTIQGKVVSSHQNLKEEIQFLIDFRTAQETKSFEILFYND
jgi:hypothetical protein